MSKQRYLLILLMLSSFSWALAEVVLDSSVHLANYDNESIWHNNTYINAGYKLAPNWNLKLNSRIKVADGYMEQFPQSKYANTALAVQYQNPIVHAEASYRNTTFGDVKELFLYPAWDLGAREYHCRYQHQGSLALGTNIGKAGADIYLIGKALYATPTDYIMDPITFETTTVQGKIENYEDIYSGINIAYTPSHLFQLGAGADIKQANFDASDIYSINSMNLMASSEIKLSPSNRIIGSATWSSRQGDNLDPESRNLFTGQLRFQQRIGTQLNGFLSIISNSCADSKLEDVYLISNLLRAQLKYTASYDASQESYLMLGGKYSPIHHTNAMFAEAQTLIYPRIYSTANIVFQPDLPDTFMAKLSWFYSSSSSLYFSYYRLLPELNRPQSKHLGLGTSITF